MIASNSIEKKKTAVELYLEIVDSVETIKNDNPQRFPEAASVGDYMRQGDVYIELLDKVPSDVKLENNPNLQVVPGNTKGSRHTLDSVKGVKMYIINNSNELQGPILDITEERTLTHPEHGDIILPANRVYAITYQRAYADELKRAMD